MSLLNNNSFYTNYNLRSFKNLTANNKFLRDLKKFDNNEYSKIYYDKLHKNKVDNQNKLIRNVSQKLLSVQNINKDIFINKIIIQPSTFSNNNLDERKILFNKKYHLKKYNNNNFNTTNKYLDYKKKITDFYEMNDKFMNEKKNFYEKNNLIDNKIRPINNFTIGYKRDYKCEPNVIRKHLTSKIENNDEKINKNYYNNNSNKKKRNYKTNY